MEKLWNHKKTLQNFFGTSGFYLFPKWKTYL